MTPNERYQHDLQRPDFVEDEQQRLAVIHTQGLYDNLLAAGARKPAWLDFFLRRKSLPIKGLYFKGGTGRGKTYLVDCFYECLPFNEKYRVHFHRFMLEIHEQLKLLPRSPDPLRVIGGQLAGRYRVLCLDEFHVHDIGDAMIMAGMLDAMFKAGLVLVATSNISIHELYKNGLQRERFLPAIDLLQQYVVEVDLQSGKDYRFSHLTRGDTYLVMASQENDDVLVSRFESLAPVAAKHNRSLIINHRAIPYRALADDVIWFDFQDLCNSPRAASDYLELACQFQTIFLSGITLLHEEQDDVAKRFIHLIDALYDHNVKLIATAAAEPGKLYHGRRLAFAFERTVSRLVEMASHAYLARPHVSQIKPQSKSWIKQSAQAE